jgi:putative heme-binding domain-containing protein
MRLAFLIAALGLSTMAARAAGPMPDFHLPPGFTVERVAAPPLVRYPLFAAFDDRGRLYVAEGTGTNLSGEDLRAKKLGRIRLLEDRDGDGTFEASRVFADGLVAPQGVLWHDGAVYTASHPSLWKLEDPDGRSVATKRTELVSGFGFNGNGCDLHGPFLGPDGRLYWTDGRHGYKVTTRDGQKLEGLAARIWRCRTDGTEVERLCGGGFDNPVEIAFTPEGEAIGTMDQGVGDCLLHYVEGGVYPMEHPCLKEFVRTGPLLGAVKQYSPVLPAALCGLTRYRSSAFGPKYQDRLFSTHYMTHRIVRHELACEGSTFRAEDSDFLTSTTHDLRLTDVLEDADGSLLFVDMGAWFTYGFPGNPPPKPDALGAIYRIRRTDGPRVEDPWGRALKIAGRGCDELVPLLDDPRPMVRDQAIAKLARIGDSAVPILSQLTESSAEARRNAVWVLCRVGTPAARGVLREVMGRETEPGVRRAAIRALGLLRDEPAVRVLSSRLEAESLLERRAAAEALGRIGKPEVVGPLLEGMSASGDSFLDHSLIYALVRINDARATRRGLSAPDRNVRRGALIALDGMADGDLRESDLAPLLESFVPEDRYAAVEVLLGNPHWVGLATKTLHRMLARNGASTADLQCILNLGSTFADDRMVQREVAIGLGNPESSTRIRKVLLAILARGRVEAFPDIWMQPLERFLSDPDSDIGRKAIEVVKLRGQIAFQGTLAGIGSDESQPPDLRLAALEALGGRAGPPDALTFAFLQANLAEGADPMLRLSAARTLGITPLSEDQQLRLSAAAESAGPVLLRLLLPMFARGTDPEVGRALVAALEKNHATEALSPAELDQTLRSYADDVRRQAERLRRKLVELQREKAEYLARLSAEIEPVRGDPDAGQEVFLSSKAGCFGCHRAVGRGGTIGPDLSRIGAIRTQSELLESIVFPGRTIAPEYRPYRVALRDGRVATGLVVQQAGDALLLRTTDLAEIRINRGELEEMVPSATSLMPEGLEKTMTRQQLRDLLEFLTTQR